MTDKGTRFYCDACRNEFLVPPWQQPYLSTPADQELSCPYCRGPARPVTRLPQLHRIPALLPLNPRP